MMGRPPLDKKSDTARVYLVAPTRTLKRIASALQNNETQSDFIRAAVETELKKRERKK